MAATARIHLQAIAWGTLSAICFVEVAAAQQVAKQPPRQAASTSDQYADLAISAYRDGNYETALYQFQKAYEISSRPALLFNIGKCHERMGHYKQAIAQMRAYLQRFRETNGHAPANQDKVLATIQTLRQRLGSRRAKVVIGSNPAGASVTEVGSGRVLGRAPLRLALAPGMYKLRFQMDGYAPLETDVEVPETDKLRVVFTLRQIVQPAAVQVWVNVRGATIFLDGRAVARSPHSATIPVKPGRHLLRVTKEGFEPHEEMLKIPVNQLMAVNYVLKPVVSMHSWRSWAGWPTLVAGLVGISGAIAAGAAADSYYSDSAAFEQLHGYQMAGLGLGGLGTATGLGLVVWDAVRDTTNASDLVPGRMRLPGKRLKPLAAETP